MNVSNGDKKMMMMWFHLHSATFQVNLSTAQREIIFYSQIFWLKNYLQTK